MLIQSGKKVKREPVRDKAEPAVDLSYAIREQGLFVDFHRTPPWQGWIGPFGPVEIYSTLRAIAIESIFTITGKRGERGGYRFEIGSVARLTRPFLQFFRTRRGDTVS